MTLSVSTELAHVGWYGCKMAVETKDGQDTVTEIPAAQVADPTPKEKTQEELKTEFAGMQRTLNEFIAETGAKNKAEAVEMIRKLKAGKTAGTAEQPLPPAPVAKDRPVRPRRSDFVDAQGYPDEAAYDTALDKHEADTENWREANQKNRQHAESEGASLEEELKAIPAHLRGGTDPETNPDDSEELTMYIRGTAYADVPDGQVPSPAQFRAAREKVMGLLDRVATRRLAASDKEAADHRAAEPPASKPGKPAAETGTKPTAPPQNASVDEKGDWLRDTVIRPALRGTPRGG